MDALKKVSWWLMVIGAVNWGLVGVGMLAGAGPDGWNIVRMLLGSMPWLEAVVYVLVGISAVYSLIGCKDCCKAPEAGAAQM